MNSPIEKAGFFHQIVTSGRVVLATMTVCCFLYTFLILGVGQLFSPFTADGSLLRNERGEIIGSESIAQGFSRPEYFWPRPSAVDYNATAAGGSNLSPTNPELRSRAEAILAKFGATDEKKIPADLVTASGSGLDPQITLSAAEYQVRRVIAARGLPSSTVTDILHKFAIRPGGVLTPEPMVNVLRVNMALDGVRQ
jgi:K+-transporting ATPase ATPase C chain